MAKITSANFQASEELSVLLQVIFQRKAVEDSVKNPLGLAPLDPDLRTLSYLTVQYQ